MSAELLRFYENHLHETILPFWLDRAVDRTHGGFYTCFDNAGQRLVSTDKFVWSNGRMVWILSKLAELYPQKPQYAALAKDGVRFLLDHAFLPDGKCAFLLSESGQLKELTPGSGHDLSFYVDCFVAMGLAKYAVIADESALLKRALTLYDSVLTRIASGKLRTEPYPIPTGYRMHGVPMITLNTGQEIAAALRHFHDPEADRVSERTARFAEEIMGQFVQGDEHLLEMIGTDGRPMASILGSYVNPGHTIEDMWFIMHQAVERKNRALIDRAARLCLKALDLGWDHEFGGLFQYVHKDGGPPRGCKAGLESEVMVGKVETHWATKLWWPHSEALYAFLLAYQLTGEKPYLDAHGKIFDYTFRTFPNPEREIGEWIQIRDRMGRPDSRTVALPVKDPYHITRNLLLIIELLSPQILSAEVLPHEII
jgi:N-acylglucosamine 2-epimerase